MFCVNPLPGGGRGGQNVVTRIGTQQLNKTKTECVNEISSLIFSEKQ